MVAALGAGSLLVGVSHECDHPPEIVRRLPRVTATPVDPAAPSAAIDAEVRRLRAEGRPVIGVDAAQLQALAPTIVLTQGLCEVCAVADGEAVRLARVLSPAPALVSLSGTTVAGIRDDLLRVGAAIGRPARAIGLAAELAARLDALRRMPRLERRLVCIEWLDPPYLAGHWVPELVAAAGARDVGAGPGGHSRQCAWSDVRALRPDLIVVMLCGFGVERSLAELAGVEHPDALAALGSAPVWVLDGNAYTSRPGPRVVDGAERIRAALEGRGMPGMVRWTGTAAAQGAVRGGDPGPAR